MRWLSIDGGLTRKKEAGPSPGNRPVDDSPKTRDDNRKTTNWSGESFTSGHFQRLRVASDTKTSGPCITKQLAMIDFLMNIYLWTAERQ